MSLFTHVVIKGGEILFHYGCDVFLKYDFDFLELGWWEEKKQNSI